MAKKRKAGRPRLERPSVPVTIAVPAAVHNHYQKVAAEQKRRRTKVMLEALVRGMTLGLDGV